MWNIDGSRVHGYKQYELWGSCFDLHGFHKFLATNPDPAVISYEICRNSCSQNWSISGTEEGHLVLDLAQIVARGVDPYSRGFFEQKGVFGDEKDVLNLLQFKREDRDEDDDDDDDD